MRPLTKETASNLKPLNPPTTDRIKVGLASDSKHFVMHPFGITQHNGTYAEGRPSFKANTLMRAFPERQQLTYDKWKVGATDNTAEIMYHRWPSGQVIWDDDAFSVYQYLVATRLRQGINAENIARFRQNGLLPLHELDLHPVNPLAKYQELALVNCYDAEGYALFMEQGTGKTGIVVARVCNEAPEHRRKTGKPYLVLVVCPKQLRFNWCAEFEKFGTCKGRVTRLTGENAVDRLKEIIIGVKAEPDDDFCVIVASYDHLWRSPELQNIPWDLAVADESHYGKNPQAKRTEALHKLRDASRQRMVLTGTPITNSIFDLWSQLEFLGEGWSGFTNYYQFTQFYGVWDRSQDGTGFDKVVGLQNLPFMQERLARTSLIIRKAEALPDLPDKVYDTIETSMTKEQQEIYQEVALNLMVEVENELSRDDPKQMIVQNILTKLLRLAQITSGFIVYDPVRNDDGEELRPAILDRFDPNPKLEDLVKILKEKGRNDKTIVWACFIQDIRSIMARLRMEGIDAVSFYGETKEAEREEAVRRFNEDPHCKVFVGNQAAGGTGLNLLGYPPGSEHADLYDTNANHIIYYSQNWSMPQRAQSEDRAHRRGTRTHVQITDLMIPGTIDEEIRKRVTAKIDVANFVSDVRSILRNVFNREF